jgi:TRAP-type uncharacterized transport system fused permease subunit
MQAWKYTLPAFLVPFAFVLDPAGVGLLLKGPALQAVWVTATAALGIAALAAGVQGWALYRTTILQRAMLIIAGVLLVYPGGLADAAGVALVALAMGLQWLGRRAPQASLGG